jgi:hypothetical protein
MKPYIPLDHTQKLPLRILATNPNDSMTFFEHPQAIPFTVGDVVDYVE